MPKGLGLAAGAAAAVALGCGLGAFYAYAHYRGKNSNSGCDDGDGDDDDDGGVLADVCGAIGETPMVRLDPARLGFGAGRVDPSTRVLAKLEFANPGGSVKDRIAVRMIEEAEKAGLIAPGRTTLVEATSGNTGIAVAMVGAARGYRVVVAMPRVQAMCERYILIRSFGGKVLLSDPKLKSQGFLDLAESYAKGHPEEHCYLLRQFTNKDNPEAHYRSTGPEIWRQTRGRVDCCIMGAGTGGTAVGVSRFLKEKSEGACTVMVVEPTESRVFQGSHHRVHSIVGIGTGLHVPLLAELAPGDPYLPGKGRGELVDEFLCCDTPDALDMSLLLAKNQGLLVGPSTGAAVRAALDRACHRDMIGKTIVVIAPSSGVRYIQHPMFKKIRDEALGALAEAETPPSSRKNKNNKNKIAVESGQKRPAGGAGGGVTSSASGTIPGDGGNEGPACRKRLELVRRVESCILALVRTLLVPEIEATHNLIDYGATSLTAMMLLGKIRPALAGVLEGAEIRGLKLAVVKERLWGSTRDLAHSVCVIDTRGFALKQDATLECDLVIEYCGG